MPEAVEQPTAQSTGNQTTAPDLDTMFVRAGEAVSAAASKQGEQSVSQVSASAGGGVTPGAAVPPATSQQQTSSAGDVADAMAVARELGVDVTRFKSAGELVRAMHARLRDADQYAQLGQRYAAHAREFDEFLAGRTQQQAPAMPEPAKPAGEDEWNEEKHWSETWKAPQYNPQWDRAFQAGVLEMTDNGVVRATSPDFAGMAQAVNEYVIAKREFDAAQRNENPYRKTWESQKPVLERYVKQMLDERLKGAFEDFKFQQEVDAWEQWLDQHSYEADPLTGQQKVNTWRQNFDRTLDFLKQRHPGDHYRTLLEDALAIVGQPGAAAQQTATTTGTAAQAQPTVAQVSEQRKQDFLTGAQQMGAGQRQTAIAPSALSDQPPNSEAELATMFLEAGRQLEARPR